MIVFEFKYNIKPIYPCLIVFYIVNVTPTLLHLKLDTNNFDLKTIIVMI